MVSVEVMITPRAFALILTNLTLYFVLCFTGVECASALPTKRSATQPTSPPVKTWSREALKLTGESNFVRSVAIKNLQRIPNLPEILLREIKGPQRALALDVITALQIKTLVPRLLELAVNDDSGQTYLTIDTLITADNISQVLEVYQRRLLCRWWCAPISAAAKIVVIETLGRTETMLSAARLRWLFRENTFEVRSAVLRYTRRFLLRGEHIEFLEIVHLALSSQPHQVRSQARFLLADYQAKVRAGARSLGKNQSRNELKTGVRM